MMKHFVVIAILGVLLGTAQADNEHEKLYELVENDNGESIMEEPDVFSAVVNQPFHNGNAIDISPIMYAMAHGKRSALRALLSTPGLDIAEAHAEGTTRSSGLPRLGLLHLAVVAASTVFDSPDNNFAATMKDAVGGDLSTGQGEGIWNTIMGINGLDVSAKTTPAMGATKNLRFVHCSALHLAAAANDSGTIMQDLLALPGADAMDNTCMYMESTFSPLFLAVQSGNHEAVAALVRANERVLEERSEGGETILHLAARLSQTKATEIIVATPTGRALANVADVSGWTPLHVAIAQALFNSSNLEAADVSKALVDVMTPEAANSPITGAYLHLPKKKPKTQPKGFNIRSVSPGKSALLVAILSRRQDIVDLLLEAPSGVIDPNVCDTTSTFTPLHVACFYNMDGIVKSLLKHPKIEVNRVTKKGGRSPLHTACRSGSVDAVAALLDDGRADPDIGDSKGYTPLQWSTGFFYNNKKIHELFTRHFNLGTPTQQTATPSQTETEREEL